MGCAVFWLAPSTGFNFLATSAAGALVLGLALQDTLGNLISGLVLQWDRPFEVGHWVSIGQTLGEVQEMTWRTTQLLTKSGQLVTLPNSLVAKESVTNFSRPFQHNRLQFQLELDPTLRPDWVSAVVLEALEKCPQVQREPAPGVLLSKRSPTGALYTVRLWVAEFHRDEPILSRAQVLCWYAFSRRGLQLRRLPFSDQALLTLGQAGPDLEPLEALTRVDFLALLSQETLRELAVAGRSLLFAREEQVLVEGQPGDSLYLILQGRCRVRHQGKFLAELKAGDYFVEMSLLTGEPRSADVETLTECQLLEVAASALKACLAEQPERMRQLAELVERRQQQMRDLPRQEVITTEAAEPGLAERIVQFFSRLQGSKLGVLKLDAISAGGLGQVEPPVGDAGQFG